METVVRIKTSCWGAAGCGIYYKRSMDVLRRKTRGDAWEISDILDCMTCPNDIERVKNFHTVEDGVYLVSMIDVSTDWETGITDNWNYELLPYQEPIESIGKAAKLLGLGE